MPKKMRQGALRSALSERVREGNVIVVDGWTVDKPKTKEFVASLMKLGLEGKTLIVDSLDNENLLLSTRNVQRAKVVNSFALNIYDLLYHEKLVLSRRAAEELEQLLGPKRENGAREEQAQEETPENVEQIAPPKPKRTRKPKKEAA
jgi:large subunit ribosomal protein L4